MQAATEMQVERRRLAIGLIPAWLRNPAGIVILVSIAYTVFSVSLRLIDLGRPFGGYYAFSEPGASWAKTASETPAWWMIDNLFPEQNNLRLETINGLPYTQNARDEFAAAAASGRQSVTIGVTVDGMPQAVDVPIRSFTLPDLFDFTLANTITGLVFVLLAIEVLRARPNSPLNQSFAIIAALITIHRFGTPLTVFSDNRPSVILGLTGAVVASAFIGAATYRFAMLFPTTLPRPQRLVRPYFIISALVAAVMIIARILWPPFLDNDLRVPVIVYAVVVAVVLYLLSVIALLTRLVWSWFNERETRRERQAALIIAGGVALASPILWVIAAGSVPSLTYFTSVYFRGLDLRYLFPAIPLTFAFVIIRYQTFRMPTGLFMFVVVMSLSAVTAAVGAWFWQLAQPLEEGLQRPPFAGLFAVIFATAGFWSLQASQRGWFGRFLNWERSSYDAARTFGRQVMDTTEADLTALPHTIARALVDELQLERAVVWLWRSDGAEDLLPGSTPAGWFEPAGWAGKITTSAAAMRLPGGRSLLGSPRRIGDDETTPTVLRPLAREGIEAIVSLESGGQPLGLLGLGKRWDEAIFDDRDLAIAELVGQQATLFLLAAQQVEQLRRVPGLITEAQEHERLSLARELHDTTQQFLGRLPFYLATSKSKIDQQPQEAIEILERSMTEAGSAAAELRRIRVNLAPNMLETSLTTPLEDLVNHVRARSGLQVLLTLPPTLDTLTTPPTRHALYRVIQQAMDNAVNHAQANRINVSILVERERLLVKVADDGRGITHEALEQAAERGSFGLKSMRTRLESVGGRLEIHSALGEGTIIEGWVPAADGRSADPGGSESTTKSD